MNSTPEQIKNELDVIGKIGDLLKIGVFQGTHAQDVAIAQMYVKGLYNNLEKIYKQSKEDSLKLNPSPVVADSVKASVPK